MKFPILLTVLLGLCTYFSSAQENSQEGIVPGQLIIQVAEGQSVDVITRELSSIDGTETGVEVEDQLSRPMNIWLLQFDDESISSQEMLKAVRSHRAVSVAQFNHYVSLRETVPNDPQFGQQWHHKNTGQTGGTAGADIQTNDAWDITTGGLTADNDEIVVCVIEGGNLNHPDLAANAWVNNQEIPNNGIDDDGNGYVDDYLGWNVSSEDDSGVLTGGHGTSVMGMIGAVGDNGTGVVGANWDVKIMSVAGENIFSEASVIEAYSYPLEMRMLYNSSNGTQGAFVVATNASWGIDNGNPDDVPLWCAFYDTLGQHGILNCGATANNNVNIDAVGDIPTACASPYMVSVTATNHNDQRTFSAYGITTIDVGAPGSSVRTTSSSSYTTTSGTSFASPLTAGVIGLLYSVPCPSFMDLVKADPQAGADMVRQALFDGVDPVASLANEVVTGGRINAFNSLQLLLADCNSCSPDVIASVNEDCNTGTFTITLDITDGENPGTYNVLASVNGAPSSTVVSGQPQGQYVFGNYDFADQVDLVIEFIGNPDCNATVNGIGIGSNVAGCTDPQACNYNPSAVCDDGSCLSAPTVFVSISTDCWGDEVSWNITDEFGAVVVSIPTNTYGNEITQVTDVCLGDGCYTFNIFDGYGDGMFGSQYGSCSTDGNYTLTDGDGNVLVQMPTPDYGSGASHNFCVSSQPDIVCDPGFYIDNGECAICPAGFYCPGDGVSYPCAAGTSQDQLGQIACNDCPPGSYSDVTGATTCIDCAAGSYQDQAGQTSCLSCPAGSSSDPGATSCDICDPGYYDDNGTCTICPPGSYCPGDGNAYLCSAGTFQDQAGQTQCVDCSAGSFSSAPGATSCQLCPEGTFSNITGSAACADCPAGTFQDQIGQTNCPDCPAGTFSDVTGSVACTDCPSGSSSTPGSTDCTICDPGYFDDNGTCALCPPGTYCPGDGNSYPCAAGEFSAVSGAESCEPCAAGTYNPIIGATSCQPCEAGSFSNIVGAVSCTDCPEGTSQGLQGQTECVLCPAGTFSAITGATECTDCSSGTYQDQLGSTDCIDCPAGSSSDPGATSCDICDPGYYDDNGTCTECPPGTFCPGDGNSYPCAAGEFSAVSGAISCEPCAAGTYNPVTGATSCQPCEAGSFSNVVGAASCTDCPAGTSQGLEGQTACIDCAPGTYSAITGATECTDCLSGTYQDQTGSTDCIDCPAGSDSGPGATACSICEPGYYDNNGSCTLCPPGTYCPGDGNSYPCAAGTYQSNAGAIACLNCDAGYFSEVEGATECTACPAGTFQSFVGASACNLCPGGTYQDTPASTECLDCPEGSDSDVGAIECENCNTTESISEVVCDTYTAPDGLVYTSSGQYTAVIPNAAGCDSVIAIDLTVITVEAVASSTPADPGFANGSATVTPAGGTAPYTYQWNDSFEQTTPTALGLFQGTYSCTVTDANSCSVVVEVVVGLYTSVPATQVHANDCNSTNRELTEFVACNVVQGADAYRWQFIEQGGSALPEYTRLNSQYLRLQWVSGIQLGTVYNVRVKARVQGDWGDYGVSCTISTAANVPLTEVRPEYHPTNASGNSYSLCDFVIAYSVSNATNYRWRFDPDSDPNSGNEIYYTRGSGNPSTRLSWVGGLMPGTTYSVAVEAEVSSSWGGFGSVHTIDLAGPPAPVLRSGFCNQTYPTNGYVLSTSVCAANYYQFEFVPSDGGPVSMISSGNYVAFFNNASPPLTPGDYMVRVRVNQGGVIGPFGLACPITIAGAGVADGDVTLQQRMLVEQLSTRIFPNPNAGNEMRVEIDGLDQEPAEIGIVIYDLYGRLISEVSFKHAGASMSRLVKFEDQLSMGVYAVRVSVDGETKSVERMVVK